MSNLSDFSKWLDDQPGSMALRGRDEICEKLIAELEAENTQLREFLNRVRAKPHSVDGVPGHWNPGTLDVWKEVHTYLERQKP